VSKFLNAALAYAAIGWYVFPCVPGGKEPLLKGGGGCKGASADPDQIRKWWTASPKANIGLACGKSSGVYVVDVDCGKVNGWDSLQGLPSLPQTITADTPSGGAHFLFRSESPPANKNAFKPGIDIRGDGYYIILAPSVHPNGKEYQWREGHSPWDIELAPFPDCMRPQIREVTQASKPVSIPTHRPHVMIEDRARLYLQQCEPAVQGLAGHDKLLWAARALVRGFLISEESAFSLLASDFNPRCSPPWNLSDPREYKDFRRKVSEAARTHGQKPDGWLLDEHNLRQYHGVDPETLAIGERMAASLLASAEESEEIIEEPTEDEPAKIDNWLLSPPGLVGDVCKWINGTALKSQPLLALAASLTLCGAVMGRKVRDEWDNRTNLYTMSVAPSSAGKGHARKQIKRLVEAAGITDLLGGEDVTSDAAIERRLEQQPTTFFLWDEIGHMMQSIRTAGANPHLSKVLPTLMKLYSASGEIYMGKEYATGERKMIEQPCCCLYGTTTPDKLADGISPAEIKDGFLGRVLVFISNSNPTKDFDRAKNPEIPEKLIEAMRTWWMLKAEPPAGTPDIDATTKAWQITVPTTSDAQARFLRFEQMADEKSEKSDTKGIDALWGKAGENARKIALIVACGVTYENPCIEEDHADYACQLVTYLIDQLAGLVTQNVAESQHEKDKQYLLKVIKKGGKRGMSRSELTRCTQKFDSRTRETYLKDLIDAQEIKIVLKGNTSYIYQFKFAPA
jgi:hypothetical protein